MIKPTTYIASIYINNYSRWSKWLKISGGMLFIFYTVLIYMLKLTYTMCIGGGEGISPPYTFFYNTILYTYSKYFWFLGWCLIFAFITIIIYIYLLYLLTFVKLKKKVMTELQNRTQIIMQVNVYWLHVIKNLKKIIHDFCGMP